MWDTGKVNTGNTGKKNDRTGNFSGRGYRKQLLRDWESQSRKRLFRPSLITVLGIPV